MKIVSRIVIGGVPTRCKVRKSGRSLPSGCGICAKNSASAGSPPRCVSPSFPPPRTEALPAPNLSSARPSFGPPQWGVQREQTAWEGKTFFLNLTAHCVVGKGQRSMREARRPEHDGTVRVLSAARIADCRCCPFRIQCQGHGTSTKKPRRVSAVLHPLPPLALQEQPPAGLSPPCPHPILWGDWSRGPPRRAWIDWQRSHQVTVEAPPVSPLVATPSPLSRAERAHWRLT